MRRGGDSWKECGAVEEMWSAHSRIYEGHVLRGKQRVPCKEQNGGEERRKGGKIMLGVWKGVLRMSQDQHGCLVFSNYCV